MDKLTKFLEAVSKEIGDGYAVTGSSNFPAVEKLPTGILSVDCMLNGGIPLGGIIELFGPEGSGKSSLALSLAASCIKRGGTVVYVDAEHALNPKYAEDVGIDFNKMALSQTKNGEQSLVVIDKALDTLAKGDLIIVDSVAALTPRAEIEGDLINKDGDMKQHVATLARLVSQAMKRFVAKASIAGIPIVFINQVREKVGVMYGNPEITPGGRALKFSADMRMEIRRKGEIKEGNEAIGHVSTIRTVKSRYCRPYASIEVDLIWGKGFSKFSSALEAALNCGVITRSGPFYDYKGIKYKGQNEVIEFMKAGAIDAIEKEVGEKVYGPMLQKELASGKEEVKAT
jgi:recombination protein RecA